MPFTHLYQASSSMIASRQPALLGHSRPIWRSISHCDSRSPQLSRGRSRILVMAGSSSHDPGLKNTYWVLRHGRSKANEAGRIVSHMEHGILPEWNLAEKGIKQATAAGDALSEELGPHFQPDSLVVYASPFSRTMQTAQLAAGRILGDGQASVIAEPALRERDFGSLEYKDDSCYRPVWEQDLVSTSSKPTPEGGESVEEAAQRLQALMKELENRHASKTILLVAHGDTISILTAAVLEPDDLRHHRQRHYLDTGEHRLLYAAAAAS